MTQFLKRRRKWLPVAGLASVLLLLLVLTVVAAPTVFVDDGGSDDQPGQKDLNQYSVDQAVPPAPVGGLEVTWNWDEIEVSGSSYDACMLFDTDDADDFANYSICMQVEEVGGVLVASTGYPILYTCDNDYVDKCQFANGTEESPITSTCIAEVEEDVDPFENSSQLLPPNKTHLLEEGDPTYTDDIVATCTVDLAADIPGENLELINVCSYPSQQPNSDPSDCTFSPVNGILKIVKKSYPGTNGCGSFGFTTSPLPANGLPFPPVTLIPPVAGEDYCIGEAAASFVPPGNIDITELIPPGFNQYLNPVCTLEDTSPTGTNPGWGSIDDVVVNSNQITTCTFTNNSVTAVTMGYVHAVRSGDMVEFTWQTASESGTAGFNVLTDVDGDLVQVNEKLIVSSVVDSLTPNDYAFTAKTDASVFYIQEVTVEGKTIPYGPYEVGQEYGSYQPEYTYKPYIFLPFIR